MGLGPGAPAARWVQNWMGGSQTLAPRQLLCCRFPPPLRAVGSPRGPGAILDPGDTAVNKTDWPALVELIALRRDVY